MFPTPTFCGEKFEEYGTTWKNFTISKKETLFCKMILGFPKQHRVTYLE